MAHTIMTNVVNFSIGLLCVGILHNLNSVAGEALPNLQKCIKGYFFDDVTKKCENCYVLCIDAGLQRTEDKCAQCKDGPHPMPSEVPQASTPEATSILVVTSAVGIVILLIVGICLLAFFKRHHLKRICQHLQARLSVPDTGQGKDVEDVAETSLFILTPQTPEHDPQNVLDYSQQMDVHSCQKTGTFVAHQNGQMPLVHAELQESMNMGPAGIDVQETLLKTQ